jgi:hypothetical protein
MCLAEKKAKSKHVKSEESSRPCHDKILLENWVFQAEEIIDQGEGSSEGKGLPYLNDPDGSLHCDVTRQDFSS